MGIQEDIKFSGESFPIKLNIKDEDGTIIPYADIKDMEVVLVQDTTRKALARWSKLVKDDYGTITEYEDGVLIYVASTDILNTRTYKLLLQVQIDFESTVLAGETYRVINQYELFDVRRSTK